MSEQLQRWWLGSVLPGYKVSVDPVDVVEATSQAVRVKEVGRYTPVYRWMPRHRDSSVYAPTFEEAKAFVVKRSKVLVDERQRALDEAERGLIEAHQLTKPPR